MVPICTLDFGGDGAFEGLFEEQSIDRVRDHHVPEFKAVPVWSQPRWSLRRLSLKATVPKWSEPQDNEPLLCHIVHQAQSDKKARFLSQVNFIKRCLHECANVLMTKKSQHGVQHIVFVIFIGIRRGEQGRATRSGRSVWCLHCQTKHSAVEVRLHPLSQTQHINAQVEEQKRRQRQTTKRHGARCAVLALRDTCKASSRLSHGANNEVNRTKVASNECVCFDSTLVDRMYQEHQHGLTVVPGFCA